ncbi:MAG: CRISPR-associated endonuclease Cas1 [Leptospiraceae bacterium]|nr:CRISPR-associated endonuclease Cas1 [Leptospiraceae bacterium]
MADLFIAEHGTSIHKYGDRIRLKKNGENIFEMEIKNVNSVQIFGYIQFSTQVLEEFLKRGIDFSFYNFKGELLGQLASPFSKSVEMRILQHKLSLDDRFRLDFSKEILKGKFESSILLLSDSSKHSVDLKSEINELQKWKEKLENATEISGLMGIEGSFAVKYFDCLGRLFKKNNVFNGRSKRPPLDIGNSILSFLYTLASSRVAFSINGVGFDPCLSFFHSIENGRLSLAYDIFEPLRPAFCDRLTLKVFNLNMLQEEDFEKRDKGFYLKPEAIKKFLKIYADEIKKEKNYGFAKGSFYNALGFLLGWTRACLKEEKILSMGEFQNE